MSDHDQPMLLAPALLLLSAVAGFVFSNSQLDTIYQTFLQTPIAFKIGTWEVINKSTLLKGIQGGKA